MVWRLRELVVGIDSGLPKACLISGAPKRFCATVTGGVTAWRT